MGRNTKEEPRAGEENTKIDRDHDRKTRKERKRLRKLKKQRQREAQTVPADGDTLLVQDNDSNLRLGEKSGQEPASGAGRETPPPEETDLTVSEHISRLYESQSELTKEAAVLIQDEASRVIQFAKKQLKKDRQRLRQQWDHELQVLRNAIAREQEDRKRALTYYKKRVSQDARALCRHYDRRVGRLRFMIHLERTCRLKSEKKLRSMGKDDSLSGRWGHNGKATESFDNNSRLVNQPATIAESHLKPLGQTNEQWKLQEACQPNPPIKSEPLTHIPTRRDNNHVQPCEAQPSDDASTRLSYLEGQHELQSQHMHNEALSVLQFLVPYFPACHNPVLMDGSCAGCKTWLDSSASAPLLAVAQLANGLWTAVSPGSSSNIVPQAVYTGPEVTVQYPPPELGRAEAASMLLTPSSPPPSPREPTASTTVTVSAEQTAAMSTFSLSHDPINQSTTSAMGPSQRVLKKPTRSKLEQCAMLLNQSRQGIKRKRGLDKSRTK